MMKLSVLLLAIWLHYTTCRRLRDTISNEIGDTSNYVRSKDWVRISHDPVPLINAPVGTKVEIECEIIGSPAPSVQWLKGNTPITDDESFESNMVSDLPTQGIARVRSRLVIPAALSIHGGTYMCVAESGSQIATGSTRLIVTNDVGERNFTQLITDNILGVRQTPRIVLFYQTYMDVIGNDIILPCKTVGNPPPSVIWLNPHDQVLNNDRAQVLPDGSLRLRNIRWSDMGPYTCVARNVIDRDHIQTFLYPMLADK